LDITESTMRLEGTLKPWNDDRGFGFIELAQGGAWQSAPSSARRRCR
jgi:hypothetical protein